MRNVNSAALAALQSGHVRPFYLVSMQCTTGMLYVWSGVGTITWNGHDWLGLGHFGGISPVTATSEVSAENITLTLSGVDPSMVEIALNEVRQNFPVEVWLGFLDDNGQVITDPVKCFSGHCDVPTVQDSGETCSLSITAENPLVDLERATNRRYTHDDQQLTRVGDKGFTFVAGLQQWNGKWGKK